MPFLSRISRVRSTYLLAYVAVADTCVWLCGLPFELYCKRALPSHHADNAFLILILLGNAALLALMTSAMAGSAVLAWQKLRHSS